MSYGVHKVTSVHATNIQVLQVSCDPIHGTISILRPCKKWWKENVNQKMLDDF